jgi:hypothetical protein
VALWIGAQEYTFIDIVIGPRWTGVPQNYKINATYDGVTFKEEKG